MATIIEIQSGNPNGSQLVQAATQIKNALSILHAQSGLMEEAIAVNAAKVETIFGVSTGNGQAMSDRLLNLMAAIYIPDDTNYSNFQMLRDFINDLIYAV